MSGRTADLLRGLLKANLVHHLAHTGDARAMLRIGRAYGMDQDWLPRPAPPLSALALRGIARVCSATVRELGERHPGIADLERSLQRNPGEFWAHVFLGLAWLRMWDGDKYFGRALSAFDAALKLRPDWAWGWLLRGEARRSLIEYAPALKDYDRAISLRPGFAWAYAFKARVLFQRRTSPRDLAWMNRAIALDPKAGWMRAWRAESLRRLGRAEAARREFEDASRLDPIYDQAYCWRAKLEESQGRHEDALRSLEQGIRLCPDFEKAYRQQVRVLRAAGRTTQALRALERAARLNHRNNWLGNWRVEGWRLDEATRLALGELDALVEARPRDAWARAWRGETLSQLGEPARALGDLDEALRLDPVLAWAHTWRGECLLALGRNAAAAESLDRAALLDPGYGRTFAWRGRLKALAKDWFGAAADFDRAMASRRVEYAWIYAWRGQARLELGRGPEGMRDLEAAIRLDGGKPEFKAWRAQAGLRALPWDRILAGQDLLEAGDLPAALSLASEAARAHGAASPWLYLLRYRLKRALGAAWAERDVATAFRRDPGCAWVFGMGEIPEGAPSQARELAARASAFSGMAESSHIHAYLGHNKIKEGRLGEGLADLRRAAALEPAAWILAWLGEAERQAGRLDEALESLDASLSLDGRYGNAYAWRASVRMARGELEKAKADLDLAAALAPSARVFMDRARLLRRRGRDLRALEDLCRAVRRNSELGWDTPTPARLPVSLEEIRRARLNHPREARFEAWQGETLLRMGRPREALGVLDRALARNPSLAWAHAWRAEARLRLKHGWSFVEADLRRAIGLDGRYARAHALAAEAALSQGRPALALERATRAIRLDPVSARLYALRAKVYEGLGRAARAREDSRRCLRLCPTYPVALPAGKSLEFFINYSCNAKCPFCFNPTRPSPEEERGLALEELARRMYAGHGQGYRSIKFIGGEPTAREDLPKIIGLARKIGFRSIQVTTNGLRLASPAYARKLVDCGADSFRFSVHGPDAATHDGLVGVPGALDKVEAAVRNLRPLGVRMGINHVLTALNVRALTESCLYFYRTLGMEDVIIYFLRYQGFAALPENKALLSLRMSEAAGPVRAAFSALRRDGRTRLPALIHFPPCALPELTEHMLDWTRDPSASGEGNASEDRMALPDGREGLIHGVTNQGKGPVRACGGCRHRVSCLGVERGYVEEFGDSEFAPVLEAAAV